jgi:hypothetical protein
MKYEVCNYCLPIFDIGLPALLSNDTYRISRKDTCMLLSPVYKSATALCVILTHEAALPNASTKRNARMANSFRETQKRADSFLNYKHRLFKAVI